MIFIVEDDELLRRTLEEVLRHGGHAVKSFGDAESALAASAEGPPELMLSDIHLPGMDGLDLLKRVGAEHPDLIRIAMTAHSSVAMATEAIRDGCYDYLEKPVDIERLERIIARALEERRAHRELDWVRRQSAAAVLGDSDAVRRLRDQVAVIADAAATPPPVLITGETGVGKGLLARAIHDEAFGDKAPWIHVNCAALPDSLVEAELFGHEKSAFTDAQTARAGLFEAAHKGTLFLDEIGALAAPVQAKLLQVVESGSVRRIGGTQERKVDALILAATNEDLGTAVAEGRFRADLLHRISAFPIVIPPLRERGDDVVLLARSFLRDCSAKYRRALTGFTTRNLGRIRGHSWPGNVRELRFAVERAVLLAGPDATLLDIDVVGVSSPERTNPNARSLRIDGRLQIEMPAEGLPFDDVERAFLIAALERTNGNVTAAADLISLSADQVRYRLKRLGIEARSWKRARAESP